MAEKNILDSTNIQNKRRQFSGDEKETKKAKTDDIVSREKALKEQIQDCYQIIYLQEDIISELKIKLENLEVEKCRVFGHIWVPDKSYGSKDGELVCDRCQMFN